MRHALILFLIAVAAGCNRSIVVEESVRIVDPHSGWYDVGIQSDGKNKLVPSIAFKLQNVSQAPIRNIQVNAIFYRANLDEPWDESFVMAIDRNGVAAGVTSREIVLRTNAGYTGEQARLQMLQNKEFVDAKVVIFGKHGSRTWAKLAEYPIDRQLLTQ